MAYLASVHKASSVRHAVKSYFFALGEPSLVVAKSNRAEIYNFSGEGLTLRTSFSVYGKITALLTIHPSNSLTEHLFIGTDRYEYFTVSWDADRGTIRNERTARDVADRFLRDARSGPLYLADPGGRMLALHVYEGLVLLLPLLQGAGPGKRRKSVPVEQIGNLDEHTAVRIKELKVVDMAFVYGTENPMLAVLHRDGQQNTAQIKIYEAIRDGGSLDLKEPERFRRLSEVSLEPEAKMLITIPSPIGGLIIVGEQCIWYNNLTGGRPVKTPLHDPLIFNAWGRIDDQRYVLGDEVGGLRLMFLDLDDDGVVGSIKIEELGRTSIAERLVYLDNGHVFVASHSGDSQLVRLSSAEPQCQVVQSFSNLAPILDFRVLNLNSGSEEQQQHYSSGQVRIVAASGGFYDGGLRSLKSGVGLDDSAILGEMEGVRSLWGLRSNPSSECHDILLVSFVDETRIFNFDPDGEVEELEDFKGFVLDEETLTTANLPGGQLLQVTALGIKLVDAEGGTAISEARTSAGMKFTMASVDHDTLVCNIGGTSVVVYDCKNDLREIGRRKFSNEVACLTVSSIPAKVCAVGFWTTSEVAVLSLPDLSTLSSETLEGGPDGVAVPRSIILTQVLAKHPPTLLLAMGDGTVYSFSVSDKDCTLSQKKSIALATQGVYFQSIPRGDGIFSVFAACDHPNILYGEEGRIVYAAVTSDKVTHVAPFNALAFPSSVVCMVAGELKIASVDTTRNVHVKTLSIGDVVRRVAYSQDRKVFGIVTINRRIDADTGDDLMACYVRIIDDESFSLVDFFELEEDELVESIICARLDNGDGSTSEKFLVGTGFQDPEGDESTRGRLMSFEFSDDRRIKLAAEMKVKGSIKCIDMVGNKIVAALNKTVEIYSYSYPTSVSNPQMIRLAQYRAHSEPIDLGVYDDVIAVGDLMKGPSLLKYAESENGKQTLRDLARTYQTSWTTAVEMWDMDTVVAADSECNMSIWRRNASGITEEDRKRLQLIGEINIGEMVNRIRRVDESLLLDMTVHPKAYFATVDGSVYLLGEIAGPRLNLMMQLQTNLAQVIKGTGDLDFNRWRAFSTPQRVSEEPFRFVDGDFVERFLELPQNVAESVVDGLGRNADALGVSVDELRGILEGLKRLH